MTDSFFLSLGGWFWMIAGFSLMALELVVPGTIFLWFGLAALVTGAVTLGFDIGWQAQVGLFAVLSCVFLGGWWMVKDRFRTGGGDDRLNSRAARHIGRRFILTEPIVAGSGRVRVDDTVWRISGTDCPAGTEITVTAVDGAVLQVEPVRDPT